MPKFLRATAAWRISIWTSLAFALGTALAFSIVYLVVAKAMQEHSDAWLSGEADVLARVSDDTPRDRLYNRVVGEVAELAAQELPDERNARGQRLNSVFFLELDPGGGQGSLWVGPGSKEPFQRAIDGATLAPDQPQSISVAGWPTTFRVVAHHDNGRTIYLGLSNRGTRFLLRKLTGRFLLLWGATVLMGFLVAYWSTRRTLLRVQSITDTVARLGSGDLAERLPEPVNADEISRLAQTFNHMLDRIQSSVNELRSVTDAVAHDLKSPVTSIRAALESALSNEPSEHSRDALCEAIEGLDRLLVLLNTTLDVAEAQAGALRLDRESVDLSGAIRQIIDLYQPALDQKQHTIELDLEDGVFIEADCHLMNRALTNLIENELAHLPAACRIAIRLSSKDGSAALTIQDNGPGFPPDIGARALERFVRGKHSQGHGLGLAFVDAVVRAHGGSARIGSGPSGGAVVSLSLPAKALQAAVR
ncbi:MAG TPA: ATP-binding protein [Candidatus Acidoferrales bacterium]|jgi:signal transduction histidine kinase|nr:ATP-binding protein [Candidatus Acidoferrales bacterium]